VIDIETMFAILARKPEIEDKPGAASLKVKDGLVRFETSPLPTSPIGRSSRA